MACEYTLYGTSGNVPRGTEIATSEVAIFDSESIFEPFVA